MERFKFHSQRKLTGTLKSLVLLLLMCSTQLMHAAYKGEDDFVHNGIHYRMTGGISGKHAYVTVINASHQYDELGNVIPISEGYSGNIEIPQMFYYKDFVGNGDVEIPYYVESIDRYAFYNCSGLESVSIPGSVKTIWGWAFAGCINLTEVILPADTDYMEESVFEGCTNLRKVVLPQNIKWIPERAFYGCKNLVEIEMPLSVLGIWNEAFEGCESLPTNLFHIGNYGNDDKEDEDIPKDDDNEISKDLLIIGQHVETIGRRAFARCNSITSLTLPANLLRVDCEAFAECENLTEVTVNMKEVESERMFDGCLNLKRIIINKGVELIWGGSLTSRGIEEVHIPDIETLLNIQFKWGNPFWGEIELGDGWGKTQYYSLYKHGEKVTNLVIPDGINHIGDHTFAGCEGLTSVTIPSSVASIGEYSFQECISLTDITLPNSIITIGTAAFGNCI